MVKLVKSESMRTLLTSKIMLQRYKGSHTFQVVGESIFKGNDGKEKEALILGEGSNEYLFVLNKTNNDTLLEYAEEHLKPKAENEYDLIGFTIGLETYETGNIGSFAIGIRVFDVQPKRK